MISPLEPGDPRKLGKYRLLGRLGAGGMGVVYLGECRNHGLVAIKVIRPEVAADPEYRRRFRREVVAAESVGGVCTCRVLDAALDRARPYLVTEYVAGPTLADVIRDQGPLPVRQLRPLALGLAEALVAIHNAGIAHRDLKPANVILGESRPKIIDFGIARWEDATSMTRTGIMIGTPGWMAPEQVLGDRAGQPADVFAWASTIVFAASGHPPFGADGRPEAVLYKIVHDEPDLAAVPSDLLEPVRRVLLKDPAERPSSTELAGQISAALGSPVEVPQLADQTRTILDETWTAPPIVQPRVSRSRVGLVWGGLVAALVAAFIALAAFGLKTYPGSHPPSSGSASPAAGSASRSASAPATAPPTTMSRSTDDSVRPVAPSQSADVAGGLRFDPARFTCSPYPKPQVVGAWQVSAPRHVVSSGEAVEIGLRDKPGGGGPPRISAVGRVISPDGTSSSVTLYDVPEGEWGYAVYPNDFPGVPRLYPAGIYTVMWTDTEGRFLSCDGWQTR